PFPLSQDAEQARKPEHEPLWEGTLEDGDLLYIPRGWWHVAFPMDEPTLHLTVGVHNRTGLDLLRWVSERLRASEIFRKDLPRFTSDAERAAHVSELRREFLDQWDDAELLKRFFDEQDAVAEARACLSLPWSAASEVLPSSNQTLVRWLAPRPLELKTENGVVEFSCQKKRWRFSADALLVLRPLAERRVCSVALLCEAARGKIEEQTVRAFLCELILHGLLAVVSG
ncbi:MAG: cupin domain-containing protein, partial [Pyrinomonadaceae bacterium]